MMRHWLPNATIAAIALLVTIGCVVEVMPLAASIWSAVAAIWGMRALYWRMRR